MTFEEILVAVDQLSQEERQRLRQYLDQTQITSTHTPEERIQIMDAAATAIREGLTLEEPEQMITAMNEEYIENWDESEWTD
jgi:hypothetical protein